MEFKLVKVIFKNIKVKNKNGDLVPVNSFYLEHEGLKPIRIVPKNNEDYKLLEFACEKRFSDYEANTKDNSEELLK